MTSEACGRKALPYIRWDYAAMCMQPLKLRLCHVTLTIPLSGVSVDCTKFPKFINRTIENMPRIDLRRNRNRVRSRVRRRRFAMTLNNPTPAECIQWNTVLLEGNDAEHAQDLTFFIVQTEKGDGTTGDSPLGTLHYQAYCEFKKAVSFSALKQIFGDRVHIENARANSSANIRYCSKTRTRFSETPVNLSGRWGTPKTSGMVECAIKALEGASLDKLVDEHPLVALLHMPKLENLIAHAKGPRTAPPKITILTGLTGCGKSQYCMKTFGTKAYWVAPPDSGRVWWGHYVGQDVAIFDDFHSGWFTLTYLLRMFDSTPLVVAPKGGQVPFNSGHLVITSNVDPKDFYLHYVENAKNKVTAKAHKDALERRFQDFATVVDCSMEMVATPRGPVEIPVRRARTELFKFNKGNDFSINTEAAAGVGDMPYGNYFG